MFDRMRSRVSRICSGDLSYFGGPVLDDIIAGRIRAEQMSMILQYLPWMMLANGANALILVVAFWNSPERWWVLVWATAVLAFAATYGIRRRRVRSEKPETVSARTVRRAARNAFLLGCIWAASPLLFFAGAASGGQIIITCLCAGMLGGGAFAFASLPVAAIAFTSPIFIASSFAIARTGDHVYFLVAVLMVVYTCVLLRGVFVHGLKLIGRMVSQWEIEKEIRRDALTKLPNRVAFQEALEAAFYRMQRGHEQFAVSYLDLDQFKGVNDKLGHAAGDELLMQVAGRLSEHKRKADLLARLSGDEFALVLTCIASPEHAWALLDSVMRAFDAPFHIDGVEIISSACAGIAIAPAHGSEKAALLKHADEALYSAKRGVGGSVQLFDPESAAKGRERRALASDLRGALQRKELYLEFQPLLDIHRNRIVGAEALLRWMHPSRGVIGPSDFIQIAEETELIHPIGEWVLREACRTAARWPRDFKVAVNFSSVQLRRASILPMIINVLSETSLSPSRLEAEITETILISEDEFAFATLNALRSLGVRIALDDFGTGYSSLSYLRKLPLDRIKIDGSFIKSVNSNRQAATIVRAVLGLGRGLGLPVLAEGVETNAELRFLQEEGCSEVQGYLLGRPAPIGTFCRYTHGKARFGAEVSFFRRAVNA